ncbi:protein-tyrosine phosphatase-like protein [Polychytrium aggregatum]|uniref:protein-tyrosine phosphatase-like protein n=1 Tax=Polychytrium aggregatum TaxID=110093 RepID=UPI0022FDD1F1|nr:protein-tyrosine phosphatase-like protein [Polychytrium aggregatum]KAI9193693.1 protein-tyrosine phosphatase-like protein [Polychytrium aggregatum]
MQVLDISFMVDEVVPSVYLSGIRPAQDPNRLRELGITHIVDISNTFPAPPNPAMPSVSVLRLGCRDVPEENILIHMPKVFAFVDAALARGGKVLVHCVAGISRSPTLVTAWIMKTAFASGAAITVEEALDTVQRARPYVQPNEGFLFQLGLLETHRSVEAAIKAYEALANSGQLFGGLPMTEGTRMSSCLLM